MRRGFTLIELMIVIAIVGILGTLIAPILNPANRARRGETVPIIEQAVVTNVVNGYEVSVAFEYDGVRVYKFFDNRGNKFHFFSKEISR